jgi:predicted nucleotidyltransferase
MTITPESAARALVARASGEQAAFAVEVESLRQRLPSVSKLLRRQYGARRVVLFGSLAWGGFHEGSDVDIAVEGVSDSDAGVAMADASTAAQRLVEIFRLEDLPASFRQRVLRDGLSLP